MTNVFSQRAPLGDVHDPAYDVGGPGSIIGVLKRVATILNSGITFSSAATIKIWDGTDTMLVNADGSINVAVVSGASNTQYTEGDTDATITGTAVMWEDTSDTLRAVSAAKPLPVGDAGGTLTVDAPVGTPVFVRLSDGASAISTLPVSLASVPSHAVTNAGTFVVQENGSALTALQLIDDIVHSGDAALSKYAVIGAVLDDAATGSVTENQANSLRMSSRRALLVEGVASGTSMNVVVASALPAGTNNIGDVDVLTVPSDPFGANADAASATGSISAKLRFIASTGIPITGTVTVGSHAVTNAGTFAVQAAGDVAHDSGDSGSPVKIGFKAIDIGANPTGVTANDRSNAYGLRNGVMWGLGGAPNIVVKHINVTDADGAQTDTALVTVSAGTAIVVTCLQVMADGANSGDVGYRIGFGTANTPANDANTGMVSSHPGVKAGSGVVVGNGGGVIGMGASNEDLRLTCEDPAGGALDITVTYFTVEIG